MIWTNPYFSIKEFDSPDAPGSGELMDSYFIERLALVRAKCGFPFIINSGYRTPSHNAKVGGKQNSAHLRGLAADIMIQNDRYRFSIIKAACGYGFRRIEIGTIKDVKLWVHLDIDDSLPQDVLF
jgi:hypothetical protein